MKLHCFADSRQTTLYKERFDGWIDWGIKFCREALEYIHGESEAIRGQMSGRAAPSPLQVPPGGKDRLRNWGNVQKMIEGLHGLLVTIKKAEGAGFTVMTPAEGAKWAELVNEVTVAVRALGPYTDYRELALTGVE